MMLCSLVLVEILVPNKAPKQIPGLLLFERRVTGVSTNGRLRDRQVVLH